jgi:hypothetical protein
LSSLQDNTNSYIRHLTLAKTIKIQSQKAGWNLRFSSWRGWQCCSGGCDDM